MKQYTLATSQQYKKFSWRSRLKSFRYALAGFTAFFRTQHNAMIHAFASVAAISMSLILHLPLAKFVFIAIAIGLVWMAELFNTAIEQLCDMISPQAHPTIKYVKDLAAAAVFISALVALVIGCITFIPALI